MTLWPISSSSSSGLRVATEPARSEKFAHSPGDPLGWPKIKSHHHRIAMANTSNEAEPLSLTLRIGISGSRHLSMDQVPRIRGQVTEFLRDVRMEVARLAQTP